MAVAFGGRKQLSNLIGCQGGHIAPCRSRRIDQACDVHRHQSPPDSLLQRPMERSVGSPNRRRTVVAEQSPLTKRLIVSVRCPVALCHKRFGFSPGMIIAPHICSICGGDLSECEHLGDRFYQVRGGPGPAGICPVCLLEHCEHSPEETYSVEPVSIIKEVLRLDEVSIVTRPVQPEARMEGILLDRDGLIAALGPGFRYGADIVTCSECLQPCRGFDRLPGDPRLGYPH